MPYERPAATFGRPNNSLRTSAFDTLGGAPHGAQPFPPNAGDDGEVLHCRLQRPPLTTIPDVPEELPMPGSRCSIGPCIESRPHEPTVGAC